MNNVRAMYKEAKLCCLGVAMRTADVVAAVNESLWELSTRLSFDLWASRSRARAASPRGEVTATHCGTRSTCIVESRQEENLRPGLHQSLP